MAALSRLRTRTGVVRSNVPKPSRGFHRRTLAVAAGIILYVTVTGAIATYAVGGGPWTHAATSADPGARVEPLPMIQSVPAAPIVVSITILDDGCEAGCQDAVTIHCATTTDRIAVDSLLIPRADYSGLYHELGCK